MIRSLFFAVLLSVLVGTSSHAQPGGTVAPAAPSSPATAPAQPTPEQAIAKVQATLKSVAVDLAKGKLTEGDLQHLRDQLDPVRLATQNLIQDLAPKLAAIKARLTQLGPPPHPGGPAEAPEITAERSKAQKEQTKLDGELTQAKLAQVDAQQLSSRIATMRSALFLNNVFAPSYSIVSPTLWTEVASETPYVIRSLQNDWRSWTELATERLDGMTWLVFLGALAAIAFVYGLCAAVVRRILARDSATEEPTRLAKALAALWVTFLTALAPILTVSALVLSFRHFGLADPAADPFLRELVFAVVRVSLAHAIARGLLSPSRPNWRLLDLTTPTCERLQTLIVAVALVISSGRILDSMADQIAFSVPMSSAIRSITALSVALTMAVFLRGVMPEQDPDAQSSAAAAAAPDWYAPLRLAVWTNILILLLSVVLGYVAFSAFLLRQLAWVSLVGAALYELLILINEGLAAAFQPRAFVGRALLRSLGVRRDSLQQFGVIASGVVSLAAWIVACLLVLAPWGVESSDMLSGLQAAYFGFQVGGVTISLAAIAIALILFVAGLLVTRWIQRWFDSRLLPSTQLDVGLRNSIRTSLGYLGVVCAAVVALGYLGVNFQRIAIVAGALSVGIGFGLQSIVNNFVSGLILLWERSIRVGDLVVIGEDQGHVKRINVRATEIETFDRVTMIVPNSNLVTGVVKNWVRGDRMARIKIVLTLDPGTDLDHAREIILSTARENASVERLPAPAALLTSIDGGALKFQLICFVSEVEIVGRVTSDLNFELYRRLKAAGIAHFAPQPPPAAAPVSVQIQGLAQLLEKAQGNLHTPED